MRIVTVDRQRFRLEMWDEVREGEGFRRTEKMPVGLGQRGYATPRGVYSVIGKSRKPDWQVPDSEWAIAAGLKPGTIYEYDDPKNPFAGGFIALSGGEGVGIHGTKFDPEVGTRGSHGCVRMEKRDFLHIYDRVPVGMPVVIL